MDTKIEAELELIFMAYFEKTKSGKTMLRLSNGREAQFFMTSLSPEDLEGIHEDDIVNVTVKADIFNSFNTRVVEISKQD